MHTWLLEPGVLLASVPDEPQLGSDLVLLRETLLQDADKHCILDLSHVEMMTSPSIGRLMLLRKAMLESGRLLVLCGTKLATKCTLSVVGLDNLFEFARDRYNALQILHEMAAKDAEEASVETEPAQD